MTTLKPTFTPSSRKAWRDWLARNHAKRVEIWLVYYKQQTGRRTLSYSDSLEVALCYGWIDGLIRKIDDDKYARRFTPRKATSKWSPTNLRLAEKLIKSREMTTVGLKVYEQRIANDTKVIEFAENDAPALPPAMENELKKHKRAWDYFQSLAPSHKKQYIGWLASAKREETQKKRLEEAIKLLTEKQKLGLK